MNRGTRFAAARALLVASSGRLTVLFAGILVPMLAFGVLANDVWRHTGVWFDEPVLLALHRHGTGAGDTLAILFTVLGSAPCMIVIATGLAIFVRMHRGRRDLVFLLAALGGAAALNVVVKSIFQRSRPMLWLSPAPESDYGFPSGHSMASMTLAITVIVLAWRTRWRYAAVVFGVAFALAVSGSRLYLGVHYPSDVLGGWAAAIAWVTGVYAIVQTAAARLGHTGDDRQDACESRSRDSK